MHGNLLVVSLLIEEINRYYPKVRRSAVIFIK